LSNLIWACHDGPQSAFLASTVRECMYGGAAAGGKTDALLVCDLRWADHPLHRSIYLRRTRPQLQEAIDRTLYLYPQIVPGANWQEGKSRWEFPSGAIYQMGYAEHEPDILNYKSFEYNVVKFDELTTFTEKQYKFMFMRNRSKSKDLPLWIRSATNPGDVGHEFVYNRFIAKRNPYQVYTSEIELEKSSLTITQQFIPSFVWDNPSLPNRDEYIAGLMQMGEDEVAAYLYGQWTKLAGAMFKTLPLEVPASVMKPEHYVVRCIDYGWQDHTAVYWLLVYDNGEKVDIAAELYVNQTTIEGIAHLIKQQEQQLAYRGVKPVSISIGSPEMGNTQSTSAQSLQSMLAMHGVPVTPSKGGPGSRKVGWTQMQRFLQAGRLRVWEGAAPNFMRTLPIMMRDLNKPDDLRAKQEDHAVDSIRYGLMAIFDPIAPAIQLVDPRLDNPNFDTRFDKLITKLQNQRGRGLSEFF
jgi:hypothetical protein